MLFQDVIQKFINIFSLIHKGATSKDTRKIKTIKDPNQVKKRKIME